MITHGSPRPTSKTGPVSFHLMIRLTVGSSQKSTRSKQWLLPLSRPGSEALPLGMMTCVDTDKFRYAQVAEKELQAYLAEKDPTLRNVDQLITEYVSSILEVNQPDFSGIDLNARILFSKTSSSPSPKTPKTDFGKRISK